MDNKKLNFNPGMGIYQFASLLENDPAEADIGKETPESAKNPFVSGTVIYVPWKKIEPEEGIFRWDKIDALMEPWIKNEKRCILRICPARREIATPEWVFKAGARYILQHGMQTHSSNDMAYENRFPVYWDKIFLEKYSRFIKEFAKKYDNSKHVEAIQIALGKWGEAFLGSEVDLGNMRNTLEDWKKEGYTENMGIETFKKIIMVYKKAFKKTPLICMLGGPFVENLRSTGSCLNTEELAAFCVENEIFLQQNGFSPSYNNYVNCSNIFKRYYRKTKVMYEISGAAGGDEKNIAKTLRKMLKEHVSYAFLYTKNLNCNDSVTLKNLEYLYKKIGYQIELKKVYPIQKADRELVVDMLWLNNGTAPVYDELQGEISVVDSKGKTAVRTDAKIEPGLSLWTEKQKIYARLKLKIPASLKKGKYNLMLSIKDTKGNPMTIKQNGRIKAELTLYSGIELF